jgi:TatD DNase family protein
MYDTHVHFEMRADEHGIAPTVQRAIDAGVSRMLAVGGTPAGNAAAMAAAEAFPGNVRAAVGLDRGMAAGTVSGGCREFGDVAGEVIRLARDGRVAAVGETGLDFFHEPGTAEAQRRLFGLHLELAAETGLPLVIHSRDAEAETLDCLRRFAGRVRGVLHCFTGSAGFASALLDLGMHISLSGIVSFRNADSLRAVAASLPADRLLIETDSPYLAPVPVRGRRNEPSLLPHVLAAAAMARGQTVEETAKRTASNALALFG